MRGRPITANCRPRVLFSSRVCRGAWVDEFVFPPGRQPRHGEDSSADGRAGSGRRHSMGIKVVFLDVDGVISSERPGKLDLTKLHRLTRVCTSTGACIVVSSHWRLVQAQLRSLVATLRYLGCQVIGVTPSRQPWALDRPLEIADWLRSYNAAAAQHQRPPIGWFVAVDDRHLLQENGGTALDGHFVWTDPRIGLTDADAQGMIERLSVPISAAELRPLPGASDDCIPWPGGYVLLTRRFSQPPKTASSSPVEYTCAFIAAAGARKAKRPTPWIVRDDTEVRAAAAAWGGGIGGLGRRVLSIFAPPGDQTQSSDTRLRASGGDASDSDSSHGHGHMARLQAEGEEERGRVHGGSALLQVLNSTGEEALAAGLGDEDGGGVPHLAPGGVIGVLKKESLVKEDSKVSSPRTPSPKHARRGVQWGADRVIPRDEEAQEEQAAVEEGAAGRAEAHAGACGGAVDAPGVAPGSPPLPASGVSTTGGGYGGSRCEAVNAAICAFSAASSPSSSRASSRGTLSPEVSRAGSIHGGRIFARVFGHKNEPAEHEGLCTASVSLTMVR